MENEKEILEEKPAAEAAEPAVEETAATAVASADGTATEETGIVEVLGIHEEPYEIKEVIDVDEPAAEEAPKKLTKMQQFLQILKFTAFSISAGVIQFVSTGVLSTWTSLIPYWIAYLIGLVLSVVWNFTLNRKFTFKAANNVPLAMCLVVLYYCAFTPLSTFGADAIVESWKTAAGSGWSDAYEMVITASMMILNFVTEFIWDKLVVFNQKVTDKILSWFKKKDK